MKTQFKLRTTELLFLKWFMGIVLLMTTLFVFSSCTKMAHESLTQVQKDLQDSNVVETPTDNKDFTESDEDLTTVDYKEFYDQLSPFGEWIQVSADEVGLKSKIASTKSANNNNLSFSNLFGVKNANADADMGMVFVWQPSPDLTIAGSVGDAPAPEYRPYSDGQWINSDEGWYFRGRTPYEETVSHHGRWVHSHHGWLWVPGRVWAPAWVDWRQNDDYVSWAPLPPSDYMYDGNMGGDPMIDDDDYMVVNRNHFCDPDIYRYNNPYYDDGSRISISLMVGTVGLVVSNNILIDRGPDVNIIQNYYGNHIEMVNINHVRNFNEVRYGDKNYNVYSPEFNRYRNKDNSRFTKNEPKSFKNYNDLPERKSAGNNSKNENMQNGKQNNGNDNVKKQVSNDNGYSKTFHENVKQSANKNNVLKLNGNDKVTKQNGNNNTTKQNGNDKVTKQNSNNNVTKQKSTVNKKQQQSNNNTKQQQSNNNTKQQQSKNNTRQQQPSKNNTKQQQPSRNNTKQQQPSKNNTKQQQPSKNNTKQQQPGKNNTKQQPQQPNNNEKQKK